MSQISSIKSYFSSNILLLARENINILISNQFE